MNSAEQPPGLLVPGRQGHRGHGNRGADPTRGNDLGLLKRPRESGHSEARRAAARHTTSRPPPKRPLACRRLRCRTDKHAHPESAGWPWKPQAECQSRVLDREAPPPPGCPCLTHVPDPPCPPPRPGAVLICLLTSSPEHQPGLVQTSKQVPQAPCATAGRAHRSMAA